jgi:hypothetical protein
MVRAEAKFAWHLKRGQRIYGPISHRELRLLAELGHLRPDDSLWRPGLGSWISTSSVPGVTPLVSPRGSQTKQWDLIRIGALFLTKMNAQFSAAPTEFCRLALSTRQHARSVKDGLQRAYDRGASHRPNLDLIEVVRRRPHQGIVAGLLVIAVFVGALDFAMKSSSATDNKAQIANSVAPKFQDRPSTEPAAATPPWANPLGLKPAIDLTEAEAFSVSNGHPTGGFVLASTTSESQTESVAQASPIPVPQSVAAAGTDAVPLPTKKPERPSVKEARPNTPTLKRMAQRPKVREAKPMQFGIIGYNYSPQQ